MVNGAQSLSVLYRNHKKISRDLRLIVKVIEISENDQLAKDITIASNNQNSIKPRDMRSTHLIQTRLQAEFVRIDFEGYRYLIKRGEETVANSIGNDDAGRLLLAFDVREPWSCHQIYKVFDEKYNDIFGRPSVTAWRIILLNKIMERIVEALPEIQNVPLQRYRLTRYLLAYAVAKTLDEGPNAKRWIDAPEDLLTNQRKLGTFLAQIDRLARFLCLELRFELGGQDSPLDYKAGLKSPLQVQEIEKKIRRAYLHDVTRGKEEIPGVSIN